MFIFTKNLIEINSVNNSFCIHQNFYYVPAMVVDMKNTNLSHTCPLSLIILLQKKKLMVQLCAKCGKSIEEAGLCCPGWQRRFCRRNDI